MHAGGLQEGVMNTHVTHKQNKRAIFEDSLTSKVQTNELNEKKSLPSDEEVRTVLGVLSQGGDETVSIATTVQSTVEHGWRGLGVTDQWGDKKGGISTAVRGSEKLLGLVGDWVELVWILRSIGLKAIFIQVKLWIVGDRSESL